MAAGGRARVVESPAEHAAHEAAREVLLLFELEDPLDVEVLQVGHASADEFDVDPVQGFHGWGGGFVADAPVVDEARALARQGHHVEAPGGGEVRHAGEAERVGSGGLGRVFRVDPLDHVLAGYDVRPLHGHAVEVEGGDVAGHHRVGLLEFLLDLVGVEEGEAREDSLEELRGEGPGFFGTDLLEEPPHRVGGRVDCDRVGGGVSVVVVRVDQVVARVAPGLFLGRGFAAELAEGVHAAQERGAPREGGAAEGAMGSGVTGHGSSSLRN